LALCERCGEEIAVANDLDRAGDIHRDRRVVKVAVARRLAPKPRRPIISYRDPSSARAQVADVRADVMGAIGEDNLAAIDVEQHE
jgi:hypothetical protein